MYVCRMGDPTAPHPDCDNTSIWNSLINSVTSHWDICTHFLEGSNLKNQYVGHSNEALNEFKENTGCGESF